MEEEQPKRKQPVPLDSLELEKRAEEFAANYHQRTLCLSDYIVIAYNPGIKTTKDPRSEDSMGITLQDIPNTILLNLFNAYSRDKRNPIKTIDNLLSWMPRAGYIALVFKKITSRGETRYIPCDIDGTNNFLHLVAEKEKQPIQKPKQSTRKVIHFNFGMQ